MEAVVTTGAIGRAKINKQKCSHQVRFFNLKIHHNAFVGGGFAPDSTGGAYTYSSGFQGTASWQRMGGEEMGQDHSTTSFLQFNH